MTEFDCKIAEQFNEERLTKTGDKPDPTDWAELIQTDPDLPMNLQGLSTTLK